MTMKLHYSPASPYVRKVLVCAEECGVRSRIELVTTAVAPHAPNTDYGRIAPLMKLPVLERDDGSVLFDSVVICEYLDEISKGPRMFPPNGEARWRALRLHALGDGILDAALLARFETALRPAELRWDAWLQGQMAKVEMSLDYLERSIGDLEGEPDIGRVAVGCALGYLDFRFSSMPWRDKRPRLAAWFKTIGKRPSFEQTLPHA